MSTLTITPTIRVLTIQRGGATPTGPAGGDLSGGYPNPTVAGVRGLTWTTTAPTDGQVAKWDQSLSEIVWATGGGGGGVTSITAGTGLTGGTITTSGTIAADFGTTAGTVCQGNDSRLSDARTPTAHASTHAQLGSDPLSPTDIGAAEALHGHGQISTAGTIGSTANLPLITRTGGEIITGTFGTGASTFCEGNDSRLSDSRTPTGSAGGDLSGTYPNPTVANDAVTFSKFQNIATDSLVGRDTAGTGDAESITVGGGIEFTGAGALRTTAFTGDVTKTAGGTSLTIANDAVTYAKIQNVSATDKLLGRSSAGAGDVEEIDCTAAGRALLDDADAAAQRTTLGISTAGGDLTGTYPNPTIASIGGVTLAGQVAGRIFRANGSGGLIATRLYDPATTAVAFTECTTTSFNDYNNFQSGAGAGTTAGNADTPRVGIAISDTGTTATGRAAICTATTFTWAVGTAALYYESAIYLDDLSDGTNTFDLTVGFFDILTAITGDRIAFEYTDAAGTGAQWDCVTQASGGGGGTTRTSVGSNVVLNQWYKLAIEVNAAGTSVAFYIDGVLVATHTTNIPQGAQRMGSGYNLRKTVGTAQVDVWCDYILTQQEVTR